MPRSRNPESHCCPPVRAKRAAAPEPDLATLAKALGHPIRIAIINLLKEKSTCICGEIVDELPLAQSTVSQHLNVLKKAGLIRGEVSGPKTCYCLNLETLERFKSLSAKL